MKKVLVVREFDKFSRILAENNFDVINCPLIETLPLEDLSEFEEKLENIEIYDGVFLTSRQATEIFRRKLVELNINFTGKIFVLGKRSFDILSGENLNPVFHQSANTAREMLDKLELADLREKRFLFVRGEKSLRVVPEFLSKIATVDETIVYRTEKVAVEIDKVKTIGEKLESGEIASVCFFSPSAAESFLEQFGSEILHQTNIAAIGKTTAGFFEKQDLKVAFVSSKSTAEDFASELVKFLGNEKRKMDNLK